MKKDLGFVQRYENNPVLSAKDIPYAANLVYNAGVAKIDGEYVMLFRNDYLGDDGVTNWGLHTCWGLKGTNLGVARSSDGIHWKAESQPRFEILGDKEIERIYDPRLQVIDGEIYICFACDTKHGCRGGIAKTDKTFTELDILFLSVPDNRNMVLFPEKINGKFARLERPFPTYSRGGDYFDVWYSESPDLVHWGNHKLVLGNERVPFCNNKIGPAAPPVKTKQGWLTTFHAVEQECARGKNGWEPAWQKIYYAGIMLLDLKDPSKVLGVCSDPLMAPLASYERENGLRNDVIFPCGMLLEEDGNVKIYYGAADTVECLAFASADHLIDLCLR